jgi:hypothetical protein
LRVDERLLASILGLITSESPSPYFAARQHNLSVMALEELMNFNARAVFVGEKLDGITQFNCPNNTLLADRWDGYTVI